MSEAGGDRVVSRAELLDLREQPWRRRIQAASLAAEVLDDIHREHREQALGALGDVALRQGDPYRRGRALRRWPSVHVIATAGVAADHYANGTFWPKLADLLGVTNDQQLQLSWGEAFLANLRELGLPAFDSRDDDAGSRFVGRILMHSGMPTYCLRDFFKTVADRRSKVPSTHPEEFVSWASSKARQKQLYSVDRPVSRFLQYGGDFAADVTSRAFDLLDAVASGGDGSDVPLPERFRTTVLAMKSEGLSSVSSSHPSRTGTDEDVQPRLLVDPFGQGVLLRLPAVGEAPDGTAAWLVALDGETQRVATRALFPGVDEAAPATTLPVPRPIRTVTAALVGREHLQASLAVVDDSNPILAFGDDGVQIVSTAIPGRPTWLLFPGEPSDLNVIGDSVVMSESPLPPGWAGWCLLLVDLAGASRVDLVGDSGSLEVRTMAAASVRIGDPIRGVRTSGGSPVFAELPTVELPEQLSEARWDVSLTGPDGARVGRWRSDDSGCPDDIWRTVERPVVGTFSIKVRGPWGRGASRTVSIVEGLKVGYQPGWRRFDGDGLVAAGVSVSGPDVLQISRPSVDLGPRDRDTFVRVGSHGSFMTLTVTPPHMSVSHQTSVTTTPPTAAPVRLFREDLLADAGTLIVDLGEFGDPAVRFRTSAGVAQTLTSKNARAGVYQFDLGKLCDTLSLVPQGELALDVDGALVVATIRPRKLFGGGSIDGEELHFDECVDLPDLTALVYACRAPWRPPAQVPVVEGRATLPDWLREAGPLRVQVRLEDPWAPAPIPEWPGRGEALLLEQDGWLTSDDAEESEISKFLAGAIAEAPHEVGDVAKLWTIQGLLGQLSLADRTASVAASIGAALESRPREALTAISPSRLPLANIPSLMIQAGLPWADLSAIHEDAPPIWDQRSAISATLLSAADGEWSTDELVEASGVLGAVVEDLISGADPDASAGRLGPSTDLYDSDPSIRPGLVRPLRLVPKALLDADSRTMAAIEFVDNRRHPKLEWLCKNSKRPLADLERLFSLVKNDVALTAMNSRRHPSAESGWRLIPAISLGLAFAARQVARGDEIGAEWLPRQRRFWSDLAAVAPNLVTIDLIIAELMTAAGHSNTLKENA